ELLKRINPKAEITTDNGYYRNMPFEVPSSWSWCRLEDIGNIITGNTPPKDVKEYYDGNIPFFKPTDLEQGINTKYASDHLSTFGFEQSRKLPANSILVTCIGATIGKTGLISVEGTCNQQINAIIPYNKLLSIFIYYVCISDYMQNKIKENASATTLPILNKGNFANLLMPFPPIKEQQRIVQKIEELFSVLDDIQKTLEA
uniref:restriction endonuclease subunit S n=1 Tax=Parabacteroides pacaensis TaxID=2086575 RepID=UPI0018FE0D4F